MAPPRCSLSFEKTEQLKNLNPVIMSRHFPHFHRKDVRRVIIEFLERYQLLHGVSFRDDIGSLVEQIHGPQNASWGVIHYRWFLFQVIFALAPHRRLSIFLEIRGPGDYPWPDESAEARRYKRETDMYLEVLPRIRAVWPKDRQPPFPHLGASTASGILILENLSECDFHPKELDSQLDFAEAVTVMKSLACFHASSILIMNAEGLSAEWDAETPLLFADTYSGHNSEDFFSHASHKFRKHTFVHLGKGVQNAFKKFMKDYTEVMKTYYEPNAHGLNVIAHGDLYSRNILLSGTDQCQFIDFQRSSRAPPVLDVIYFLMSSVKIGVVEAECNSLLSCYLEEFNKVAVQAGGQYHPEAFCADLQAYRKYLFHDLLRTVQLRTIDLEEAHYSESGYVWGEAFCTVLKSPVFIRTLKYWVKFFELE